MHRIFPLIAAEENCIFSVNFMVFLKACFMPKLRNRPLVLSGTCSVLASPGQSCSVKKSSKKCRKSEKKFIFSLPVWGDHFFQRNNFLVRKV